MSAQTKLTANDFQISHGRASHFQQDHKDSQQDRSFSTPLHESILFSLICGAVETHLWTVDLKQALLWSEMHYAGTLC
jgi:hypothetical protein